MQSTTHRHVRQPPMPGSLLETGTQLAAADHWESPLLAGFPLGPSNLGMACDCTSVSITQRSARNSMCCKEGPAFCPPALGCTVFASFSRLSVQQLFSSCGLVWSSPLLPPLQAGRGVTPLWQQDGPPREHLFTLSSALQGVESVGRWVPLRGGLLYRGFLG